MKNMQDHKTSPVSKRLKGLMNGYKQGTIYKIIRQSILVGSVHVYPKSPGIMRLHMINILR